MLDWLISACYYLFLAWIVVAMAHNLFRTKAWEREILYVILLLAFALRLFHLK